MTALLAEDERVTVVGTARRGSDAIEQAAAAQVDVVLMDIGPPDVDGLEVARRLRASRPQTEVIVVSAYDPADYASPARAAGAAAFVMKGGIGRAGRDDRCRCRRRRASVAADRASSYAPLANRFGRLAHSDDEAVRDRAIAFDRPRRGVVVRPEVVRARGSNRLRSSCRAPRAFAERRESVGPVESGAASEPSTVGRRILVVDDEPSMRMVCRFNLLAAGFDVREAGDGREALELIREEAVDLVLLDVMMPVLDGWEVARELQADPRTRDLPVVFLTARAERADRERAADLGAVGYVLKPFDPVGLPATIENILEQLARGESESLRRTIRESIDG